MTLMVAPLAPHVAEEVWARLGHAESLAYEPFPEPDAAYLVVEEVEIPVQIDGKVRGRREGAAGAAKLTTRRRRGPTSGSPSCSTGSRSARSSSCPAVWSTSSPGSHGWGGGSTR